MRVVYRCCWALDLHKQTVTACVMTPEGKETLTFKTMTADLLELADWLVTKGATHVAMESTGVYWRPVYNLLEGLDISLLVVNARHINAVPGRKTDAKDAESPRPPLAIGEPRDGEVVFELEPGRRERVSLPQPTPVGVSTPITFAPRIELTTPAPVCVPSPRAPSTFLPAHAPADVPGAPGKSA